MTTTPRIAALLACAIGGAGACEAVANFGELEPTGPGAGATGASTQVGGMAGDGGAGGVGGGCNPAACPGQTTECQAPGCDGLMCTLDYQPLGTPCDGGMGFCNMGTCAALLADGETCDVGTQCSSTHCVDGFCCDSTCDALDCVACHGIDTVSGMPGLCEPIANGFDPDDDCPGSTCNGVAGCN